MALQVCHQIKIKCVCLYSVFMSKCDGVFSYKHMVVFITEGKMSQPCFAGHK